MAKKTTVGIFIAAAAALAASSISPSPSIADDQSNDLGGLKEWTTDQDIDEEPTLDEAAKKAAEKAKKANVCIPIGEGENCW
tara:strand:- start:57 stop:302 length:246 start_codon:yes stop_codon:yes gene_type:complete